MSVKYNLSSNHRVRKGAVLSKSAAYFFTTSNDDDTFLHKGDALTTGKEFPDLAPRQYLCEKI